MTFEFRNIGKGITEKIRDFLFAHKSSFYPKENLTIEEISMEKNENSKVYECYLNDNLVAFIILEYLNDENVGICYEISFGKFSQDVNFSEILGQFVQNYDEMLKIFAVVENSNPYKQKVQEILEQNRFICDEEICASNEWIFIPNESGA